MSKPYLIINVVEGKVGTIQIRDTHTQAVDAAVAMASEQVDTPEDEIRAEIEADTNFVSEDGTIEVMLAQWEDEDWEDD